MILIVSLEQAKNHLHVTNTDSDSDILLKTAQASSIVLEFLKIAAESPEVWPATGLSENVIQLAETMTYLALSELNENREAGVVNVLSQAFVNLGSLYRMPTLA